MTTIRKFWLLCLAMCVSADLLEPSRQESLPEIDLAPLPVGQIADTGATYEGVEEFNHEIYPLISDITKNTDFFKYYRLNLFDEQCLYFGEENSYCGNRACAVDTLEEEDVPEMWRSSALGKLTGPSETIASRLPLKTHIGGSDSGKTSESCVREPDDDVERNYCVPGDEGRDFVYVSLADNPERFTGYGGPHAHKVWGAIYRENCFESSIGETFDSPSHQTSGHNTPKLVTLPAAVPLGSIFDTHRKATERNDEETRVGMVEETQCLEKRVFWRIISGMHASISAHLCSEYLNQSTGHWGPNVNCYVDRLATFPDRVKNIYFNYVLVNRAIAKLGPFLREYTFCSGDPTEDAFTHTKMNEITRIAGAGLHTFDEKSMFSSSDLLLKDEFKARFRNISRLMDCVGCDKCRLWGKVQISGYGTALKILFEYDEGHTPDLKRTELVALVNTFERLAISLNAIEDFNTMLGLSRPPPPLAFDPISASSLYIRKLWNFLALDLEKVGEVIGQDRLSNITKQKDVIKRHIKQQLQTLYSENLSKSIWDEIRNVQGALKFILRSYWNLPRRVWSILIVGTESTLWDFVFQSSKKTRIEL